MTMTSSIPALGTILTADTVVAADSPTFYILELALDGSRRIEARTVRDGPSWVRDKDILLERYRMMVVWGPSGGPDRLHTNDLTIGDYLPYPPADGVAIPAQYEPVNQYGYLPEWRAHVATFCHSFDALPGFESFNQLSASQKVTAYRVGQTIGGHAWERLGFWLSYDASLSDDWKLGIVIDPVRKAVDAVCIECQSTAAALRLATNINATDFAAKLAAGHIHGTNRDATPWVPGELLTVVPEPSEEVSVETAISTHIAAYNGARDYYLKHVAHEVVPHVH